MRIIHVLPDQVMFLRLITIKKGPVLYINLLRFQMDVSFEFGPILGFGLVASPEGIMLVLPGMCITGSVERKDEDKFQTYEDYVADQLKS